MILNDRKAYLTRTLPSGQIIDVVPLTFGWVRLTISAHVEALTYNDGY